MNLKKEIKEIFVSEIDCSVSFHNEEKSADKVCFVRKSEFDKAINELSNRILNLESDIDRLNMRIYTSS